MTGKWSLKKPFTEPQVKLHVQVVMIPMPGGVNSRFPNKNRLSNMHQCSKQGEIPIHFFVTAA
jgi:hypothetical protein